MKKNIKKPVLMIVSLMTIFSILIMPVSADSAPLHQCAEIVELDHFLISTADVDYYPNYQGSGIDYMGITVYFTWASVSAWPSAACVSYAIGEEFSVIDTDMSNVGQGSVMWYYLNLIPTPGSGTKCSPDWQTAIGVGGGSSQYYIIAQRTDYESDTVWLQLNCVMIYDSEQIPEIAYDWTYLDLQ